MRSSSEKIVLSFQPVTEHSRKPEEPKTLEKLPGGRDAAQNLTGSSIHYLGTPNPQPVRSKDATNANGQVSFVSAMGCPSETSIHLGGIARLHLEFTIF